MKVRRQAERPSRHSISYSQLSQSCGLRLKFHRQRVPKKGLGIGLLYGRSLHAGIESYSKGRTRTVEEATKLALGVMDFEVRNAQTQVNFDDPWEVTKDGCVAASPKGNYGRLPTLEACLYWLRHQVPLYLEHYPDAEVMRSEHHVFVPLTEPKGANWTTSWSLECYLDREMADGSIHDIKTTADAWDERDKRKNRSQAWIYMAAYYYFYGRPPTRFEFHVLPRMREGEKGNFGPRSQLDVVPFDFDMGAIQTYIDAVIKPQITVIEREAYVADPGSYTCNSKWCGYWHHCRFGEGENL